MTAVNCYRVTGGEDRVDCLLMFEWFIQHTSPKIEATFLPPIDAPSPLNPVFKPDKTLLNSSTHYQQYSLWFHSFHFIQSWNRRIQKVTWMHTISSWDLFCFQQVVVCPAEGAIITWSEEEIAQSETQIQSTAAEVSVTFSHHLHVVYHTGNVRKCQCTRIYTHACWLIFNSQPWLMPRPQQFPAR